MQGAQKVLHLLALLSLTLTLDKLLPLRTLAPDPEIHHYYSHFTDERTKAKSCRLVNQFHAMRKCRTKLQPGSL